MSSHCSRYPECGCSKEIGTKCHLPYGKGLNTGNEVDELEIEKMKRDVETKMRMIEEGSSSKKPKRKYPSNYTKPKRRKNASKK